MSATAVPDPSLPWYRQVNQTQWRAFWATFLGWVLDGFDFTILTFILIDIQQSFTVDAALAGALGSVTLIFRLVGGLAAGAAADRWGRKLPLMLSILWFSIFAFLSGFSSSYTMLFGLRALFGIGMGGEWAAGMPLALEHWPARLRGIASGLLQGGYSWGYILSAVAFQFLYPVFEGSTRVEGWRVMLWIGVVPALLVLWIRRGVEESPVWLEQQRRPRARPGRASSSILRIFHRDLIWVTVQCSLLMGAFMFSYYSIAYWYATLLRQASIDPLIYLIALNLGGILGGFIWGRASEGRLGRRGSVTVASLMGIAVIPLYLDTSQPGWMMLGAALMGFGGTGMFAVIPTYLTERFPTEARAKGAGFAYHAGAGIGAFTPTVIGLLTDRGTALPVAMGIFIAVFGLLAIAMVWLGPETRGRDWSALDEVLEPPRSAGEPAAASAAAAQRR